MGRSAGILALTCVAVAAAPAAAPAASLRADLDRALRGTNAAVHVADARTGRTLYGKRARSRRPLASTTKLFTAAAAIERLGATRTLKTAVLLTAPIEPDGTSRGDVILRGDGDPGFGTPAANGLADTVVSAGLRRVTGGVIADESLFDAVRGGPATNGAFDLELDAPLSALSYDGGTQTPGGPPRADAIEVAARKFDDLLEARGVALPSRPRAGEAPAGSAPLVAADSAPIAALAGAMLVQSHDFIAEMLLKRLTAEDVRPGSTTAGAQRLAALAQRVGGPGAGFVDGSGLDRRNTATPRHLTRIVGELRGRGHAALLARPGQGTLAGRLRGLPCRAKTGTLSGVSNLAGFCRTRRGRTVTFAVMADGAGVADRLVRALVRRG